MLRFRENQICKNTIKLNFFFFQNEGKMLSYVFDLFSHIQQLLTDCLALVSNR